MKTVVWTDKQGFKHASMIRDSDPDDLAPRGVPISLDVRDVIDTDALRELNNLLVERGLFGYTDIMVAQTGLTNVILSVIRRKMIVAFKQQEADK